MKQKINPDRFNTYNLRQLLTMSNLFYLGISFQVLELMCVDELAQC